MLHGGPGLSEYTEHLGGLLAEALGEEWTVSRFQQRGLAPSTTEGPFTIEQQVADTVSVCDWLAGERVVLLGHSWGGYLAMHVAVTAPERLHSAVIIDPLGAVPDGGMAAMDAHFAKHLTVDDLAARARLSERSAAEGPSSELGVADLAILWPYYFADPRTAPRMPVNEMSVDAYVNTFASIVEHFARETLVHALPSIRMPVLFMAGTKSPIPHHESERSAALIPGAEVATRATGHFPWMEDPQWTTATIVDFVQRTT
jgi:proline iminopeptidase